MDGSLRENRQDASGISIPQDVLDDYVMMRLAELIELGAAEAAINRALRHKNFGGDALAVRAEAIKHALRQCRANDGR